MLDIGEGTSTKQHVPEANRMMRCWLASLAFSVCVLGGCGDDKGQAGSPASLGTWVSNGPEGGNVRALAIDPSSPMTLYAAGDGGGLFKTTNGGGIWSVTNSGPMSSSIAALAIDASNPQTLYAGAKGGVFKSTNGGESWSASNSGLSDRVVRALAIDPSSPQKAGP